MTDTLSPGARAALLAADASGWIHPPLPHYPTKRDPVPPTPAFRTAHVAELNRRRLVIQRRRRLDGLWSYRLSPDGWDARKALGA